MKRLYRGSLPYYEENQVLNGLYLGMSLNELRHMMALRLGTDSSVARRIFRLATNYGYTPSEEYNSRTKNDIAFVISKGVSEKPEFIDLNVIAYAVMHKTGCELMTAVSIANNMESLCSNADTHSKACGIAMTCLFDAGETVSMQKAVEFGKLIFTINCLKAEEVAS